MDTKKLAQKLVNAAEELVKEDPPQKTLETVFDSLKPKQKVKVAFRSVMGTSKNTNGREHEWLVGRRSTSKKYRTVSITLLPVDGSWKPTKYNAYKLMKTTRRDGTVYVTAAHGDMGLTLVSINGVSRD